MRCRLGRIGGLIAPLLWAAVLACSGGSQTQAGQAESYRVRALVVAIDGSGEDARVILSHEAVPGFKGREGRAETMAPMKMAFGIAPGVDASALVPGSKQAIVFDVVWGREPTIRVIEAKRLADDTPLELAR